MSVPEITVTVVAGTLNPVDKWGDDPYIHNMKPLVNKEPHEKSRPYRSELRQAQAKETRHRILEGVVAVMANGVEELSIPAVAKEAGVSVATVYRHFGDKASLVAAVGPYVGARIGVDPEALPSSIENLEQAIHTLFEGLEQADELIRAALASGTGVEVRRETVEWRMRKARQLFSEALPDSPPEEIEHLTRIGLILTTSDSLRLWKDRMEITAAEAADEVVWAVRTLMKGMQR